MGLLEIVLLIRTLATTLPLFLTILDRVEERAGKPLEELTDDELIALLSQETLTTAQLLAEGRARARE